MVLPAAIIVAAWQGNVAAIEQWLNAGGDVNDRWETSGGNSGETLLHVVADRTLGSDEVERGRCDIARLLLASAFARLIGSAPASKPRTRAAAKIRSSPGLPDPLAHLVCKFWLGSPPRRANRAATPASE